MNRTSSVNRLSNRAPSTLSRSPSMRTIYINQQTSKKSVNTHFHSPFKDGRPNPNYSNPSFISTHLFYPKQMLKKEDVAVRQSYIPHESQIRKKELYRQRINTEANQRRILKEATQNRIKNKQKETNRIQEKCLKLVEPQQALKNELSNLQNYRQKTEKVKPQKTDNFIPPYFQKRRKDNTYEIQHLQFKQKEMREYMQVNQKQNNRRRDQTRREMEKENQNLQKNVTDYNRKIFQQDCMAKNKSSLLDSILKEQMLQRQQSRARV